MRPWFLGGAILLLSSRLHAEPEWELLKENIPAIGSPGVLNIPKTWKQFYNRHQVVFFKGKYWHSWRRDEGWPAWIRVEQDGTVLDLPAKGIFKKVLDEPYLTVLGDQIRIFYKDSNTFQTGMITLDDFGEVVSDVVVPVDGFPLEVIRGKGKSLVLWRVSALDQEMKGSFFEEGTLQWGDVFDIGLYEDASAMMVTWAATFDGEKFLLLFHPKKSDGQVNLVSAWIDPEDDINPVQEYSVIATAPAPFGNVAVACLGAGNCLSTHSSYFLQIPFLSAKIPPPGGATVSSPIYPGEVSLITDNTYSSLIAAEGRYIFSACLVKNYVFPGYERTFYIESLDASGQYTNTIAFHPSYQFQPIRGETGWYAFGHGYVSDPFLFGASFDINQSDQKLVAQPLDQDLPATIPLGVFFWEGDYWTQFDLFRNNAPSPFVKDVVRERWMNRINLQGEVVAKHEIPGKIMVTGTATALLLAEGELFLVDKNGQYGKVAEIDDDEYDHFLYDGHRFVLCGGNKHFVSILYISEDGTVEKYAFELEKIDKSSFAYQRSGACMGGRCLFSFYASGDPGDRILSVSYGQEPQWVKGSLVELDPSLSRSGKIWSDGSSFRFFTIPEDWWNWEGMSKYVDVRLDEEELGSSEVLGEFLFPEQDSLDWNSINFSSNHFVSAGASGKIFYFNGTGFEEITKTQPYGSGGFSPFLVSDQKGATFLRLYRSFCPEHPTPKAIAELWGRHDVPSGGGGQGTAGAAGAAGAGGMGIGGDPASGGGGTASSSLPTGGAVGGVTSPPETSPEPVDTPVAQGGLPKAQGVSLRDEGGCSCRWGRGSEVPSSALVLVGAFAFWAGAVRRRHGPGRFPSKATSGTTKTSRCSSGSCDQLSRGVKVRAGPY